MAGEAAGELRVYVLGAFRVVHDGKPLAGGRLDGRSIEDRLFKLVAISAHAKRSQAQLAMELRRGVTLSESRVDSVVKSLRKDLKAQTNSGEWIGSRTKEIKLGLGPDRRVTVDAALFADAHSEAFRVRTIEGYEQALALYTGDLLQDDDETHIPGLEDRRQHFRRLFLELVDALDALYKAQGYPPRAIAQYRALLPRLRAMGHLPPATRRAQDWLTRLDSIVEEAGPIESPTEKHNPVADPTNDPAPLPASDYAPPLPDPALLLRSGEVEELRTLLLPGNEGERLVTLVGPGLVGKTQLALELAQRLSTDYPDQIAFVNLAKESPSGSVLVAVARRLGIRADMGVLADYLDRRCMLLILDNCEHLRDDCAQLILNLRTKTRNAKFLATSRVPLGINDREHVHHLAGLALPQLAADLTASELLESPAGRFFVEVRRRYAPNYVPTDSHARTIAQICAYPEGIPGLIGMVAVKRPDQSPEWILNQIRECHLYIVATDTADNPHQRSAEATVRWSYELLSKEQQWLLRNLSMLRGGFTDAPVLSACRRPEWTEEVVRRHLAVLAGHSLVLADPIQVIAGYSQDAAIHRPRYRLHQTVRDCIEQFLSAEERAGFKERLLAWAADLGGQAAQYLEGDRDLRIWIPRLNQDYAALSDALTWGIDRAHKEEDRARARRLGAALSFFWVIRQDHLEGERWLEKLRNALPEGTMEYAKILYASAFLSVRANLDQSFEWLEHAEQIAKELEVPEFRGRLFDLQAYVLVEQLRLGEAEEVIANAWDVATTTNNLPLKSAALMLRGYAAQFNKSLSEASTDLTEAIGFAQRGNVAVMICYCRMWLAEILLLQRRYDDAYVQIAQLIANAIEIAHVHAQAIGHYLQARLLLGLGQRDEAAVALDVSVIAARESGDAIALALIGLVRGESHLIAREYQLAVANIQEGLNIARATNDLRLWSIFFQLLGRAIRYQGPAERALPWVYASLMYHRRLQDRLGQAVDLEELAALRIMIKPDPDAVGWLGVAARERLAVSAATQEADPAAESIVRGVATALGNETYDRLLATGNSDSLATAVNSALAWCEAACSNMGPVKYYLAFLER